MKRVLIISVVGILQLCSVVALAVNIEMVPVGNIGNPGELSGDGAGGFGVDRICGAVDYAYNIGKYEITADQYCEFLNAVATTADTYQLYNTNMGTSPYGCKIERSNTANDYTYTVAAEWQNRPVNYVNWGDAARFANWLHNGQPNGLQSVATTEDGAYSLFGAMSSTELLTVARNPNATWAITSEDEWYKAAYHKNDGVTGNYFDYPTTSNSIPSNVLGNPTDPGNNATYFDYYWTGNGGDTIGSPYYRTEVGAHENSDSPYGTFDQGGNVWEWSEAVIGSYRFLKGGSAFFFQDDYLHASFRNSYGYPSFEGYDVGFRVASIPEPCTLLLMGIGGVFIKKRRK